jgi:hypothetical protein
MKITLALLSILFLGSTAVEAQVPFTVHRNNDIPVTDENGQPFAQPWIGGLNAAQFSELDLDMDGVKDLVIFDRSGPKLLTFLNGNTPNTVDFTLTEAYDDRFPKINSWLTTADFNCDGKNDLFTYRTGGVKVYKNTSNVQDGLQFEEYIDYMLTYDDYFQNYVSVGTSSVEVPELVDVDGDGYLDMLTVFSNTGNTIAYHRNVSMDNFGTCDTFVLETKNHCWGYFHTLPTSNAVNLNHFCQYNVTDPELTDTVFEYDEETIGQTPNETHEAPMSRDLRDGAHSLLALDLDDDGVKDLIIGHDHFNNLTMVSNGGSTTSSLMVNETQNYPPSDPVDIAFYPTQQYMDLDNDGVKDLIVTPFYEALTVNHHSVWWYKNTGTNTTPVFVLQQDDFLQDQMIDLGWGSAPALLDYNHDGLMDLVVGNHDYWVPGTGANHPSQLALFKNVGTATEPAFQLMDRDYGTLSQTGLKQALSPTFGDLDGDGDADMMIGDSVGNLHYWENVALPNDSAEFTLAQSQVTDFAAVVINVGKYAVPQLYDIDGDLDFDLFIGEQRGNINFYENIGTAALADWRLIDDTFGNIHTVVPGQNWGYSQPNLFEHNGQTMLLSGSFFGAMYLWDDVDNNISSGQFNSLDTMLFNIDVGGRSKGLFHDLDNDGELDMIIGNQRGGLSFYKGGLPDLVQELTKQLQFELYPNPATNEITVHWEFPMTEAINLSIYNLVGQELHSQEIQASNSATIDVAKLSPGLYFCTLKSGKAKQSARFVVAE